MRREMFLLVGLSAINNQNPLQPTKLRFLADGGVLFAWGWGRNGTEDQ